MPYISINNFKFGLDGRRSELTSAPGSLIQALDGHITQGGEFEQRKAFLEFGGGTLPNTVFGFEATSAGLVVFGSVSPPVALPAGVTYVQCPHPTDVTKTMSGVLCSCCFGGVAFCAAQFNNGAETYLFVNGEVVPGSIAGQILTAGGGVQTLAQIAQQMYNILSQTAFSSAGVFVENLKGGSFNIYTTYGIDWSPVVSFTSAGSGSLVANLLSTSTEPVIGSSGDATLTLYAGSAGSLSSLTCVVGSTTYKLLPSAAAAYTTSVGNTASLISEAITAQSNAPLSASASVAAGVVSIATNLSLTSSYLSIAQSGAGANLCFENMSLNFSGVADGTPIKNIYVSNGANLMKSVYGTTGDIYASPSGGLAGHVSFILAYGTYLWVPGANDVSVAVAGNVLTKANNPNGAVFTFTAAAPGYVHFIGKASNAATCQLVLLTDILNNAGINYNSSSSASLTNISGAITTYCVNNGLNYVASNNLITGADPYTMYISRKNIAINASNYLNIYFYASYAGIVPSGFSAITPPGQFGFGTAMTAVTGRGPTYQVVFSGGWVAGDTYQFDVVTAATTFVVGIGNLTGIVPISCISLNERVHLIEGTNWLGCDNNDATQWDEQAPGAFIIDISTEVSLPQPLVSLAPYQGLIALFGPNSTVIYELDANPDNIAVTQVMQNIGSIAPLSAQPLGDLDVLFLHSSGIRSLRARVASLNAYVADIGAAVDAFVSEPGGFLPLLTSAEIAASCAIVEPTQNRYWLYIPPIGNANSNEVSSARMFVLSYFPTNKIVAWSQYTFNAAGVPLIPLKMVVYLGQVYILAAGVAGQPNAIYVFGGTDNLTYDNTPATIQIPFYDEKKPGHKKYTTAVDSDLEGGPWTMSGSPDWIGEVLTEIGTFTEATFDQGVVAYQDTGTHFSLTLVSNNIESHPSVVPTVTSFLLYYEFGEQPC